MSNTEVAHEYVPWRWVKYWRCVRCGKCCIKFLVPLYPHEALYYTMKYGPVVEERNGKFYLRSKPDGSCIFLERTPLGYRCSIYLERPIVCRCYPFYITDKPLGIVDSRDEDAIYVYRSPLGKSIKVYVYIDKVCSGIGHGIPLEVIVPKVVSEWITVLRLYRIHRDLRLYST